MERKRATAQPPVRFELTTFRLRGGRIDRFAKVATVCRTQRLRCAGTPAGTVKQTNYENP